jgi:hypothetical protein
MGPDGALQGVKDLKGPRTSRARSQGGNMGTMGTVWGAELVSLTIQGSVHLSGQP